MWLPGSCISSLDRSREGTFSPRSLRSQKALPRTLQNHSFHVARIRACTPSCIGSWHRGIKSSCLLLLIKDPLSWACMPHCLEGEAIQPFRCLGQEGMCHAPGPAVGNTAKDGPARGRKSLGTWRVLWTGCREWAGQGMARGRTPSGASQEEVSTGTKEV